jgi:quercetin dioxygenase-like cupin family protein
MKPPTGGEAIAAAIGVRPEIAVQAMPTDERIWVPQADGVWFRPLLLNTVSGGWCNLLRVRRAGVLSRHRHPMLVVGYVIKGRWKYLEHDWTAEAGSFVYEPPGETHTLTVPEDCAEMITFFNIAGAIIYVDAHGRQTGYEDVFTKIDMCRAHYARTGLGSAYVDQFIR